MFDIISCEAEAGNHGFERFYQPSDVKLLKAENLEAALKHKNQQALIILQDHAFDEGAIKVIAEKKRLCFLIDLGRIIASRGVRRAIMISKLRTFLALCMRHGAYFAFASFAEKESRIRSPEEIMAIVALLGVNKGQARFALRMVQHYL